MTEPRRSARPRSWQEMRERDIELLLRRTGEGLDTWNRRVRDSGSRDEAGLREWLAAHGVTGYPQMLLVMERFGYPDYLTASAEELIEGQYDGRPALRPILEGVLALLPGIGQVSVQARKTYVALLTPKRTFAAVQPTTKARVDLGLRLEEVDSTARLRPAPNFGQSAVTMKIGLASADEVDEEVEGWLRRAYEQNA